METLNELTRSAEKLKRVVDNSLKEIGRDKDEIKRLLLTGTKPDDFTILSKYRKINDRMEKVSSVQLELRNIHSILKDFEEREKLRATAADEEARKLAIEEAEKKALEEQLVLEQKAQIAAEEKRIDEERKAQEKEREEREKEVADIARLERKRKAMSNMNAIFKSKDSLSKEQIQSHIDFLNSKLKELKKQLKEKTKTDEKIQT